MARCKCCHVKGFMVETDANGLCSACAPYYYLSMPQDLKDLDQALRALNRISQPEAARGRLNTARTCLNRLRPYAWAGLARLPKPANELDHLLDELAEQWQDE
jgi:hypothetical protein